MTSIAAKHAKGKSAQDKIFGANAAAVAAAAKYGKDNVTNATIGAILDEDEQLVCLPTVEKVFRGLSTNEMIAYPPISGLPEYLDCVLTAAFGSSRPEGYIAAVATAGGTGAIHHAIWNYTDVGETVLCSDWYWGAYKVLCQDMGRDFTTYKMLDAENKFNLPSLEEKVNELLAKQDNLLYLLNTPAHNPTGYSLSEQDMDGVLALLKKAAVPGKNIVLFLDIAYIDYAGEKEEVRKIFKKLSGLPANILCIVGYSMSKGFTMYGQRTGAMIGVSSDKSVIDEFVAINQYTSRATWSNINRPAMRTLATIYSDKELLEKVCAERDHYYQMIKARADLFTQEAAECGLPMLPYVAGFFLSIPSTNPDAVCDKLHEDNIFAVPLAAGVRIAVCAVPLKKIKGMAAKVNAALQAVEK
ncbi:pyridoxal phosphate-dependent aminotransferase [Phascolarctobacterium succinatutens]|uniref:pyridoxal phosphate-dependent aminotransferase n=1 Tax=Phascolarctobacterium succinatutens TaxID=626940 RepID=UPI0026ED50D9|nr:aminotransferase class I/II-fold pyridoxal phosphate-dependent enzyme [Phascolarctobacterium succinatutens]